MDNLNDLKMTFDFTHIDLKNAIDLMENDQIDFLMLRTGLELMDWDSFIAHLKKMAPDADDLSIFPDEADFNKRKNRLIEWLNFSGGINNGAISKASTIINAIDTLENAMLEVSTKKDD